MIPSSLSVHSRESGASVAFAGAGFCGSDRVEAGTLAMLSMASGQRGRGW
jgi:hypothetical protein